MKCPFCAHLEDRVVDSRESREGDVIRRRRECLKCERRFTSYERIDEIPYMVVKKDGTREPLVVVLILRPRSALAVAAMVTASLAYYGLLVALLIARLFNDLDSK